MTPATLTRLLPGQTFGADPRDLAEVEHRGTTLRSDDRRRSLDDVLVAAWEDLLADHRAACPVCDGPLEARFAAGPRPVAGQCSSCGSRLS